MSRRDVHVDDLLDARFEPLGRGPAGYDCYGIYLEVNRRLGRAIEDFGSIMPDNYRAIHDHINGRRTKYRRRDAGEIPQAGDLVLFFGLSKPFCEHIGVMLDKRRFLHSCAGNVGAHVSKLTHPLWRDSIEGIYEYRG